MYAIVKIGGSQYRVVPEEIITVPKLNGKAVGNRVEFPALLVVDGSAVTIGKPAGEIPVTATVLSQEKGEKVKTLRFRAKSRHRRRQGMRVQVTKLKIQSIGIGRKITNGKSAQSDLIKPTLKKAVKSRVARSKTPK